MSLPNGVPDLKQRCVYNLDAPDFWTPEEHGEFSKPFRDDVRMKLLAVRASQRAVHPLIVLESLKLFEVTDYEVVGEDTLTLTRQEYEDALRTLSCVPWWQMVPSTVLQEIGLPRESKRRRFV